MKNNLTIENGVASIELEPGVVTLLDVEDLPLVVRYTWRIATRRGRQTRYYATTQIDGHTHSLHQLLIPGVVKPFEIDHEDHNGLNNRRYNLRVLTHSENLHNREGANKNSSTGVLGVYRIETDYGPRYAAHVTKDGKRKRKMFPATPAGLKAASAFVLKLRKHRGSIPKLIKPRATITAAVALAIRESTASNADLAEHYKISRQQVWRIRNGGSWSQSSIAGSPSS